VKKARREEQGGIRKAETYPLLLLLLLQTWSALAFLCRIPYCTLPGTILVKDMRLPATMAAFRSGAGVTKVVTHLSLAPVNGR
jgi:hypothetical protein